ncbi:MAG TPA: M48 family metalloprotease [Mycobacteriales bacterium]|nr:M48 family metalloprotease [Mycobacteriales bacterium]
MHYSVYVGVAFAALFGVAGPFLARRLAPAVAAWLLSVGALIAAASGLASVGLLAMTIVGQNSSLAAAGHWSSSTLRRADPVHLPVAITALALFAFGIGRCAWVLVQRWRAIRAAHRMNRALSDTGTDLVVLGDEAPDAYAVPGRPGRIFVTKGMLALLSRDECRVMLAHERSHLRHRHHLHRTAVTVATALNPLLAPLPRAQSWVTERWADEDAARICDRALVASALSRAANAARPAPRPAAALSMSGGAVDSRVAAMATEPPRLGWVMLGIALTLLVLSVLGTLDGVTDEAHLFHVALLGHAHLGHLRRVFRAGR